jgi:F-type H+-transporting ATPase subunit delta
MAAREEQDIGLARVYGASVLALANQAGQADDVLAELDDLAREVTEHPDFAVFLSSPLIERRAREQVLEKALRGRASDLLVDAVQVLNRRGRVGLIPQVAAAYRDCLREQRGEIDATVVTATPLTPASRKELTAALERFSGKRPALLERVDPTVLGGIIVEIEGKKIDTSLATQLRNFGTALAERASRGLGESVVSN